MYKWENRVENKKRVKLVTMKCVTNTMNALHIRFAITGKQNNSATLSDIESKREWQTEKAFIRNVVVLFSIFIYALHLAAYMKYFFSSLVSQCLLSLYRSFYYDIFALVCFPLPILDRILFCLFLTFIELYERGSNTIRIFRVIFPHGNG